MPNPNKTPGRGPAHPLSPTSRRTRHREEADERNAYYRGLSTTDKLRAIAKRPGDSRREKRRLVGKRAA